MGERSERGRTGARWQLDALASAEQRSDRGEAIGAMFEGYLARSREGGPVHTWSDLA